MRRYSLSFLLLVLFLLACQVSKEEKIYQILNRRQEALQKRDLSLYLSCVSKDDQDKEEDFTRLERRIDGYFNALIGFPIPVGTDPFMSRGRRQRSFSSFI
jgi:O6-methylguanine-DNA--protein-cysteine methyltransferase